jgi:hypothetical protein
MSRTPTTSLRPQTSSPATSSRQFSSPSRSPIPLSHAIRLFSTRMADVQPLIWGYKFTREIARRMPHFRGEPPILHPAFAPGGPASVLALAEGPVPMDAPRIVYSEEDERALEEFARAQGMSLLCLLCLPSCFIVRSHVRHSLVPWVQWPLLFIR